MRRKRKWDRDDEDPAAGLLNLFDVWLVFAVAVLLAAWSSSQAAMKASGEADLEIVNQNGKELETLKMTNNKLTGQGQRLGTAYRLKSGKVVYVPESTP
jgi:hypothetical protein